jgi:octanoyl-[GcvH]:protein N-octanoyltransferase
MNDDPLHIISNHSTGSASLDTAISRAVLQRVSSGDLPETLEVSRPHRIVAFGKHDVLTDGFADAVDIALTHGFDPTIRIAGGRAVVFHRHTVRFAWTLPMTDPVIRMHDRFRTVAQHVVATLGTFGVPATMGELKNEYCPGAYSVHVPDTGKVMGQGQRLARHAAQVAGMIVVSDADAVNGVLLPIYATLGITMDPSATGAVATRVDVDADSVAGELIEQFLTGRKCAETSVDDTTMTLARKFQPDHDPRILA